MKQFFLVIAIGITTTTILFYWGFLIYTSSAIFVKKDVDALNNLSPGTSDEEFKKVCDGMSRFSYVAGLTDGAFFIPSFFGKSYYYKSGCYQQLAIRTLNANFCPKVVERRSLLGMASGISERDCRTYVAEAQQRAQKQQEDADHFKAATEGAAKIINEETKVEKISADSWEVSITTEGSLFGEYEFTIEDVGLETVGLVLKENTSIKDPRESFRWVIKKDQLDNALESEPSRRLHNITVGLTLLQSEDGQFSGQYLTSSGNVTIDTVPVSDQNFTLKCDLYHYSTCPSGCIKKCIPSFCGSDGLCTADCDGLTSCVYP